MTDKNTYDSIVENIKQVLETYVQPAVAGHGGVVNYLDYNDGVVTLLLV
jgi:Fe-S cluster biogenesis protein NfuA